MLGLFSKPKRAVGIDIGSHSVKVVEISRSGLGFAVHGAVRATIDPSRYAVDPTVALTTAVSEATATFKLSNAYVVCGLSGQSVVIRYPRLPKMPPDELRGAVELEAAQSIPYNMEEVSMDSTPLEDAPENGEEMVKVLLVAAKNEIIDARLSLLEQSGIRPHVIAVDSLALADAMEMTGTFRHNETVALVNVGASATNIHFCKNGVSNFVRDVSWGGRDLVDAIQKSYKVDREQAELVLVEGEAPAEPAEPQPSASLGGAPGAGSPPDLPSPPKAPPPSLDVAARAPISRLLGEVRRSFDYYEHQLYQSGVDRVVLSGGVAPFPLLRQSFVEELGVSDVEIANPVGGSVAFEEGADVAVLEESPAQFVVAVGLAGRGAAEL
jgi:type IV pilus assembly protein PilM